MFGAGKTHCARTALLGSAFLSPLLAVPVTLQIPEREPAGREKVEFRPGGLLETDVPHGISERGNMSLPAFQGVNRRTSLSCRRTR
jgi:hypothetical protein